MTCLHCHRSIPVSGLLCTYCGKPIQQSRNYFWKGTGFVFLFGLLGLVAGPAGYVVGVLIGAIVFVTVFKE
jgi:hypothetical protein